MRVLLVDADSIIPNLALMKLSRYHHERGDEVDLLKLKIPYFPTRKHEIKTIPDTYDKIYCSVVFQGTMDWIKSEGDVVFGGSGYDLHVTLPDKIENLPPDYSVYPEDDKAYGFISRGCIRHCPFCIVPEKEGKLRQVAEIDDVAVRHVVVLLDNNFLALPNHKELLQDMASRDNVWEFSQGLDVRLLDEENAQLLGKLKVMFHHTFAFDDWKYLPIMEKKAPLFKLIRKTPWRIRFFVYVNPNMPLMEIVWRLEWLREHECLPYVMRDISCWGSKYQYFYTDLASWCNSVRMFAKKTFFEYLPIRHAREKTGTRVEYSSTLYQLALEGKI